MVEEKKIRISRKTELVVRCHYPEENPEGAISEITRVMNYAGLFKGIDAQASNPI